MTESEINLVKKAQEGDIKAFEQLIYKYDRQVLNIAYSFKNDEDEAKDVYQEVFIRVFKGLSSFQFKSEFSTWLFRIATNVCITLNTQKRKHQIESLDSEIEESDEKVSDYIPSEDYKTDEELLNNETKKYITEALDTLPSQQKLAFTLKHYNEYKIKEIAKIMNCNEGTVKRYLFNATHRLRTILQPVLQN